MSPTDQWILISKSLAGEANADEQAQLDALLGADPSLRSTFSMLTSFWQQESPKDNKEAKAAFERMIKLMC